MHIIRQSLLPSALTHGAAAAVAVLSLMQGPLPVLGQEVALNVSAIDSATGAPVGFVLVYVDERCVGQADSSGTLTLRLVRPHRCVTVKATAVGYHSASERICLRDDETERALWLRLSPQPVPIPAVRVEATRPLFLSVEPAKFALRGATAHLAPLWPGSPVRLAQPLPAVGFRSDFSSSFYAAGADFYQTGPVP